MGHLERRHVIALEGDIERVFPLFTPVGETLWIADWAPDFLHPTSGETCRGMVFRTGNGGEETLWSCVDFDPGTHHVRYARVTPGSRFGEVEVTCRRCDEKRTEAEIRYAFTALGPDGDRYLAGFTAEAFVGMISEWKALLDAWLLAHPGPVSLSRPGQ